MTAIAFVLGAISGLAVARPVERWASRKIARLTTLLEDIVDASM